MRRRPPRSTRTDTLFPTRRSSDLAAGRAAGGGQVRLNLRTVVNVLVVFAVGLSAMVWAVVGLADLRLFGDDRVTIQAVVARAAGALPGAEVTYLGQPVGRVEESELVEDRKSVV